MTQHPLTQEQLDLLERRIIQVRMNDAQARVSAPAHTTSTIVRHATANALAYNEWVATR
ncbi:hypothetical protein LCGC14_2927110 [marine sediment metagenome]|uniref:Uncharacterized protein n=1 Tax=marine sediment metagenome TaxID=412755 RepID=A0A0F8XMC3_9ZZZZ